MSNLNQLAMAREIFPPTYRASSKTTPSSINSNDRLNLVMESYHQFLHNTPFMNLHWDEYLLDRITNKPSIISNDELQQFLTLSQGWERHSYYPIATGMFISYLMGQAHRREENSIDQFNLDFSGLKPMSFVASYLKEKVGKKLEVTLRGGVGSSCSYYCEGGTYYIENAGHLCATYSSRTNFYFRKSGLEVGHGSARCTLYIDSLNYDLGHLWDCVTTSNFHTANPTLYKHLTTYYMNDLGATFKLYDDYREWDKVWDVARRKLGEKI